MNKQPESEKTIQLLRILSTPSKQIKEKTMQETQRPTLNFINDVDGVEISMAFGYVKNKPTMALFHKETLVWIPKDVLQIAFEQGWDMECPYEGK